MNAAVLLAAAGLILALPAAAQDAPAPPPADPPTIDVNADRVTLGAGAIYVPDYEGSDDYRFAPAPLAIGSYKGFSFALIGNRISVDLIPDRSDSGIDLQLGPVAVLNFNRSSTKAIDDPRVKVLGKLDRAVELGGYVGIGKTGVFTSPYDTLSASVTYRHDVSDVHDSAIVSPSISYLTPLSRTAAVGFNLSADHAGRGYAQTYYAITPGQSLASGLPAYSARGGWKSYSVGGFGVVSLTGDLLHGWKLGAGAVYSRLLNDFADSPIVRIAGSRGQWIAGAGLAYTF